MSQNTSHQSDMTPPLPPAAKAIMLVFSIFMTFALVAFVGFVTIEFVADITGHPLFSVESSLEERNVLPTQQEIERELKGPFELITPRHETQMRGPEVVVIYTVRETQTDTPDLLINGIRHPWEVQYGDNTWFARLWLSAGLHHLRAGEAEAEFFVIAPDSTQYSPDLWLWSRPHLETNETDRCVQCHEMREKLLPLPMRGQDVAIGAWKGMSSCFACHDEEKHAIVHRSVLSPIIDRNLRCVRCHAIH